MIDFLFIFYPGHFSSSAAAPFHQALPAKNAPAFTTFNGQHSAAAASSDLPLLTGEDLKILDAFDQVGGAGGSQFSGGNSQMVYQQTTVNGHGSMMI